MNRPGDLDLKGIENREWHLWSLTLALLMVFGGITVATFFLILGDAYLDSGLTRSLADRALWGLLVLISLFCLYVLHARLTFGRMRVLLVDISSMVASKLELNELLSSFAARIALASSATLCQIAIISQSGFSLKLRSAYSVRNVPWKPQIGKAYIVSKIPTCKQVMENCQPEWLNEADLARMQGEQETLELLTGGLTGIRSVLILPMVTKGQVVGIIILGEARRLIRRLFTSSKVLLIQALAKQAATAIDHARLLEESQKSSISLLQATLDATADGILVADRAGKIVSYNQQLGRMWKIPEAVLASRDKEQVMNRMLEQLKDPEAFLKKANELNPQTKEWSYDLEEAKDGRVFEIYSQPHCLDGNVVGRVWSYRDVTAQKRHEEDLRKQAIRDSLTDLYNRRYFDSRMKEETHRADRNMQNLAILLCDLDRFKTINDTRGHQAGDEVLKDVAKSIKQATRGTDLVFRWGGDEIVVVLANTNREGILIVAERIRTGILMLGEKSKLALDLSIGVAMYPEHGTSMDELIRLADRALYIAKKGGDKVHIGEEEYHLDENAIQVVFQPVVDIQSGQVLGYEALSRDAHGRMSISELFTRYQAIGQLSELKEICFKAQLKAAQDLGLERVFLNVDFSLLRPAQLLSKPPGMQVILEISELEALHDIENLLKIVKLWRDRGFQFAIDDFGAGFISLPFVAKLIPDYIKLDRSTVLQAVSSEDFRDLMMNLVPALQNYSIEGIIAEGIETENELTIVKAMGIHLVQGFLLGKPITTDALRPMLGGAHG